MENRNPSPPPEFDNDSDLYKADSVGGTAISKHWVLKTLMEIINEVEKHTNSETKEDDAIEVGEELQDSACKLWDICMDKEIAVYLLEFDIIEILYGVILKSKSPRLTEISVGILGNMACDVTACLEISKLEHLRSVVLALLASSDTPTLLETVRLIKICSSVDSCCEYWLSSIVKNITDFASSSQFILSSSTNGKLLNQLSEVIDILCDKSNGVLESCCNEQFVGSLLEAISQQCQDDPASSLHSLCYSLHTLHLISEAEAGKPIVEILRRAVATLLSCLFYQWMTSHPKVEYSRESRMSSSEVSVSCCLSVSAIILDVNETPQNGSEEKTDSKKTSEETSEENGKEVSPKNENGEKNETSSDEDNFERSLDIDDEDRELIIKFARSVMSARGSVSALPVVSAINAENESSNEFKTPLHFSKNSPRSGTPVNALLGKTNDSLQSADTPIQTPEIHSKSPADTTPSRDNDGGFTPTTRERTDGAKEIHEPVPAAVLCDLANKVLKTAGRHGWLPPTLISTESPRKGLLG